MCVCAEGGPRVHEQPATHCRTTICSSEDVASTQDMGMQFLHTLHGCRIVARDTFTTPVDKVGISTNIKLCL